MMEVGNWMTLLNIFLKKLLMNSRDLIVKAKPRNPSSKNIQNNDNSVRWTFFRENTSYKILWPP